MIGRLCANTVPQHQLSQTISNCLCPAIVFELSSYSTVNAMSTKQSSHTVAQAGNEGHFCAIPSRKQVVLNKFVHGVAGHKESLLDMPQHAETRLD